MKIQGLDSTKNVFGRFKRIINKIRTKSEKTLEQTYTPAQLERRMEVLEYLKTRTKKDVLHREEYVFGQDAGEVPLGKFVEECTNLAEIDRKFGLNGLVTYIEQGGNKSYKGIPAIISMDKFLLNHCSDGHGVSLNKLYERFGELGLGLYKGKDYRLYVETKGLPGFQTCTLTKEGQENLRVTAIARRYNFQNKVGIWESVG